MDIDMRVAGLLLQQLVRVLRYGPEVAARTHDVIVTPTQFQDEALPLKPGAPLLEVRVTAGDRQGEGEQGFQAAAIATVKPTSSNAYMSAVYVIRAPRDVVFISLFASEYEAQRYLRGEVPAGDETCVYFKSQSFEELTRFAEGMGSAASERRATAPT
jgi:hypothetical protein